MNSNSSQANDGSKPYTTQSIPGYYQLLGLKPNASVQDIRRAYRDLSKLYHPDTTELERAIAVSKFQALNEAYATLSSPEKRLTYDYKTGYSRMSVMQPLSNQNSQPANPHDWSSSSYLDPTDRPLSAGEMFALFILGITFIGCLLLVVAISLTKEDLGVPDLETLMNSERAVPEQAAAIAAPPEDPSGLSQSSPFRLEQPETPWLVPKAPEI